MEERKDGGGGSGAMGVDGNRGQANLADRRQGQGGAATAPGGRRDAPRGGAPTPPPSRRQRQRGDRQRRGPQAGRGRTPAARPTVAAGWWSGRWGGRYGDESAGHSALWRKGARRWRRRARRIMIEPGAWGSGRWCGRRARCRPRSRAGVPRSPQETCEGLSRTVGLPRGRVGGPPGRLDPHLLQHGRAKTVCFYRQDENTVRYSVL